VITELGRIDVAKFAVHDGRIAFEFHISGKGWGVVKTFECGWDTSEEELKKPLSRYKWTHESRLQKIGMNGWEVVELMKKAKVSSLDKMVGIPVRCTFLEGAITHMAILEEVL